MPVLYNIGYLAACRDEGEQKDIHPIKNAALVWKNSTIEWVGPESELPEQYKNWDHIDAGKQLVVPGLIDCHTHLAFGGWRSDEFAMRMEGKSYLDISNAGGGILSTVKATREAKKIELINRCEHFLDAITILGITTIEAKSGYGLDLASEIKLLQVYRHMNKSQPVEIVPTFLGAHTFPPEYWDDHPAYIRQITEEMIPKVGGKQLAEFCDIFVEESAFSVGEAKKILGVAKKYGLRLKLHADQLSDGGGAALAAEVGAISADHLEYISDDGIWAMIKSGVIAVSLPIATLYLNQPHMPARKLIEAGVPVAVATDFNPGSAPSYHLPMAMMLACTMQRMTPAEVLKGTTIYAARAINRQHDRGSLEPGKRADFAIIDAEDVNEWMYHFREQACVSTWIKGRFIYGHSTI